MIYHNIDGTTQPSFKIGAGGVKIMSSQLNEEDKKKLDDFKMNKDINQRLTVYDDFGHEHYLAYDIDLPIHRVVDIITDEETGESVFIVLKDTGLTEKVRINTKASGTVTSISETTVPGNIVLYADDKGLQIKDSGLAISQEFNARTNLDGSIPTSKAVFNFFGGNIAPLATTIDGYYYIVDSDGNKYAVRLNKDGTYSYEKVN